MKRDLLSVTDLTRNEIEAVFSLTKDLKDRLKAGEQTPLLQGKTLAMIFEKPSLRTRISFETGMYQLGGHAIRLAPNEIRLGVGESIADIARNLGRVVDMIVARTFKHSTLVEFARHAAVPVINGLSDLLHPCQILTDLYTLIEKHRDLEDLKIAFVGDGNNVANSWIRAAKRFPFRFTLACPPGYEPDQEILLETTAEVGERVIVTHDAEEAVSGADVIYTDVWTSMGAEEEAEERRRAFASYQVNSRLLKLASPQALVMHCLPAHRGEEITDEVIDGPQSVVFDQAENRLHLQKGLMVWLAERSGRGSEN